jgi:uncharacterized membrane protein
MIFSLSAFMLFLLIVKIIMPSLANNGEEYVQFRNNYSAVGTSVSEIAGTIFSKPFYVFKLLFLNHTGNPLGNNYKMETYIFILLSGGILFSLRPQFWIMLIPIFAQKMFHNDFLKWGIGDHYSIEFAPICSIGAFYVISKFENKKLKKYFSFSVLFLCIALTIRSFDRTYTYINRSRQRIYQAKHYEKDYDVAEAHRALKLIPDSAKVSAQSPFVPHLAFRDYIYQFPVVNDADYIVISSAEFFYPLTKESFAVQVAMLESSAEWEKIYEQNQMTILRRRKLIEF